MKNTEEEITALAIKIGLTVAIFLLNTGLVFKAIELCQECLILLNNGDLSADSPVAKSFDERIRTTVKRAWFTLWNSPGIEEYLRELLLHPEEVKKFYELAINVMKITKNRQKEATSYANMGVLFRSLGKYDEARQYLEKALAIQIEIGDRNGEARVYGNLGPLFISLGKYDKAREYLEKALAIQIEIGDRNGEATSY